MEKENKILSLSQEKMRQDHKFQRSMGLAGLIILGLSLGFVTTHYKNKTSILQEQRHALDIEQRLLRSQMNPHFTFNALGSIQSFLASTDQADKGAYYLAKFSKLMRQILDQSRKSFITLEEELNTLDNYLSLQRLRYKEKFSYQINSDLDPFSDDMIQVPPMLIQPLVENSIEHGKIHMQENGYVKVFIESDEKELTIKVEDNGIGLKSCRDKGNKRDNESVALDIIRQRLRAVSENNGGIGKIEYPEVDTGTTVIITLPRLITYR